MRYNFLPVLAATAVPAWAQTRFGYVPGNDFAIGTSNATYDYVVVGGGTAGLAVAYRLAEDGTNSVAVVEAGGYYEVDNGNMSVVPAESSGYYLTTPESAKMFPLVDWGFVTEAQQGLGGRHVGYKRGKTFGGSSALNAMLYQRGTNGSYQAWADHVGDDSWHFDKLLPYFSKGINYSLPDASLRPANASAPPPVNSLAFADEGPLHVSFPNFAQQISSYVDAAMGESGIPAQQDFVSGSLIGRQYAPVTISYPDEERSTSRAYLDSALQSGRSNLKVYPNTLAKRITFSSNMTATGVELERSSYGNAETFHLHASKEVVISSGAFHSPQLLMVSGIGPRKQLQAHDIPVLLDRPGVGANMQDHLDIVLRWETTIDDHAGAATNPSTNGPQLEEYVANRTGPFTNPGIDFLGWEKLPESYRSNMSAAALADLAEYPADWPEIEYETGATALSDAENVPTNISYSNIIAVPVSPLSRGWVNLTSASTRDLPLVNPNQLSHPTDREVAVQALKRARSFFHTDAMKPVVIRETIPGANVTSDEAILAYIEKASFQNWHASCTCRMGRANDSMAVVDSKARVFGTHGLRVVDASSFALLPPGHPQSTVYVMAEKIAAEMLAQ